VPVRDGYASHHSFPHGAGRDKKTQRSIVYADGTEFWVHLYKENLGNSEGTGTRQCGL